MTKIYFDESGLQRLVNSNLEKSINNLEKIVETSSILSIPYDFKYRNYLQTLDNSIKEDLEKVKNVYNIIKKSSNVFINVKDELESDISNIENYSVSLRQSAIK